MKPLKSTQEEHVSESESMEVTHALACTTSYIMRYILLEVLPVRGLKHTEALQFQHVVHVTYDGDRASQNS